MECITHVVYLYCISRGYPTETNSVNVYYWSKVTDILCTCFIGQAFNKNESICSDIHEINLIWHIIWKYPLFFIGYSIVRHLNDYCSYPIGSTKEFPHQLWHRQHFEFRFNILNLGYMRHVSSVECTWWNRLCTAIPYCLFLPSVLISSQEQQA